MQVAVGYSDHPDSTTAGRRAAQMALSKIERTQPCDMALLFCTARHNQQLLREAVASVIGNSQRIFGGGAAGIITNEYFGYAGDQAGVACIWLDESRCTVLSEAGLAQSERETGARLGERLVQAGITPDSSLLLFYDAIDRTDGNVRLLLASWLLDGLEKGMGFLPDIMGAGLQGDHASSSTCQYTGEGIGKFCAISMAFSDDICVDSTVMHGCRPASPYYTVTKADGPVILEINHRPAIDFMDEVLGSAIAPENYPFFLLFGLNHGDRWGEYDEDNYASRLCMNIDRQRGGIVMFEPDMVEGMEFQVMFRSLELDYMKPKIEKVFARLDGREPLFALYIDCAGRCAGYGGMDIEDALVMQKAVGDQVPLLGIYTGAEIAPMGGRPRGLDLTGVFCLFSKRKPGETAKKESKEKKFWHRNFSDPDAETIPLEAALRLCERNAVKVLELDSKSIVIRHELEQKRRGFSLLAELSISLREGDSDEDLFLLVARRINSALNMQKTIVLFPDSNGQFVPYLLQGYSEEEKQRLTGRPIEVGEQFLDPDQPVLVTAADDAAYLATLRQTLNLPHLILTPVIVQNKVAAILITGRMVEEAPFLSRLGRSDVETVQAISALLASVLVYRKLDDANRQAQSDVLTGLLNRGALELQSTQCLQTEWVESQKSFAFMIIDCDYFKEVNDSYGHLEGDMLLHSLARFLQANFRSDDFVARIGGDEFAVFCSLTKAEREKEIVDKTARLVRKWSALPLTTKMGRTFSSTVSVGIAFAPRDGITYNELFQNADLALYKAKQLGRNRCVAFDATITENVHL